MSPYPLRAGIEHLKYRQGMAFLGDDHLGTMERSKKLMLII